MPIQIEKADPKTPEKLFKLSDVKPGDGFVRFRDVTFAEALTGKDESQFFMVIETQPKKTGRVTLVSADGKTVQEKDDDHQVFVHSVVFKVGEARVD